MPYEITLDIIPAGYCMTSGRSGEMVKVAVSEFISSEDGDTFISRLEGFPSDILNKLPLDLGIKASSIDHMIAVIRKDKTATVWINEVSFIGKIQHKRSVKKGDYIYTDDIADIHSMNLEGVTIPNDAGLLIVFSIGWRKGMFYDFWPIHATDPRPRDYDLNIHLGQLYSYLMFQERFKISEKEWDSIISQNWFPFISLKTDIIKDIINHNRNSWDIDDLIPKIQTEVETKLPQYIEKWKNNKVISPHMPVIEKAIDHYHNKDYISSISVLYPRIEGVMRSFYVLQEAKDKATQTNLVDSVCGSNDLKANPYSLLLPEKFRRFLIEVYFANFDPKGEKPLSRHSVSHGVAEPETFSLKAVLLGLLCLDQLTYYLASHAEAIKKMQ